LTWSDEFDGITLNKTAWNVRTNQSHCCGPFGGNGELELYVPEEVSVREGKLIITTHHNKVVGPKGRIWNYTSGWIDTKHKFSQMYGRFEANCSLPSRKASGIWPAFWLMPDESKLCWPTGGEIDIFEFNGNWLEDSIFGSYHWAEPGQCGKDKAPIPGKAARPPDSGSDWQRDWHVYAVEWTPAEINFFLDDALYFSRQLSDVNPPTAPMYIILDQAVDSWLFAPSASSNYTATQFAVEYVRVYKKT
jgi:beta-glucanase (GH16 family)